MKSKLLFPLILIAGLLFQSFSANLVYGQSPEKKTAAVPSIKYTCPKHAEVIQDNPGNCPKCGMKLVEKKDEPKSNSSNLKHNQNKTESDSTKLKKAE
jgi:hypothetical protein